MLVRGCRLPGPYWGTRLCNHRALGLPLHPTQATPWRILLPSHHEWSCGSSGVAAWCPGCHEAPCIGPTHLSITDLPGICLAPVLSVVLHRFLRLQCIFGKASRMLTGIGEGFNAKHLSLSSWHICWLCWAIYWA